MRYIEYMYCGISFNNVFSLTSYRTRRGGRVLVAQTRRSLRQNQRTKSLLRNLKNLLLRNPLTILMMRVLVRLLLLLMGRGRGMKRGTRRESRRSLKSHRIKLKKKERTMERRENRNNRRQTKLKKKKIKKKKRIKKKKKIKKKILSPKKAKRILPLQHLMKIIRLPMFYLR